MNEEETQAMYEGQKPYQRQVFAGREPTDEGRAALTQARQEGW